MNNNAGPVKMIKLIVVSLQRFVLDITNTLSLRPILANISYGTVPRFREFRTKSVQNNNDLKM